MIHINDLSRLKISWFCPKLLLNFVLDAFHVSFLCSLNTFWNSLRIGSFKALTRVHVSPLSCPRDVRAPPRPADGSSSIPPTAAAQLPDRQAAGHQVPALPRPLRHVRRLP